MTYVADASRYQQMSYRRSGQSGIDLPMISLGLWQNFGHDTPLDTQRAIIRRAFDLGVTTLTWRITTARRMARRRRTSAGSSPRTCGRTGTNC